MPEISQIGFGTNDYPTLEAWVASAEATTDYGVGNPAIAEVTSATPALATNTQIRLLTGAHWPRSFIIRNGGTAFDGNFGGDHSVLDGGGNTLDIRVANGEIQGLELLNLGTVSTGDSYSNLLIQDCGIIETGSGINLYLHRAVALPVRIINSIIYQENQGANQTVYVDVASNASLESSTIIANNDVGANGAIYVRGEISVNNTASYSSGVAYEESGSPVTSGDFNAGSDGTLPSSGGNSIATLTQDDFKNFAAKDFRILATSELVGAGSGGGDIGAFVLDAALLITSTPNIMRRGEASVWEISDSSVAPTVGNLTVIGDGEALVVDSVTGSGPWAVTVSVPSGLARQHSTVGYAWTFTVGAEADTSTNVELAPPAGWGYQNLVNPVTSEGSILENFTGDTPVSGDQVVYQSSSLPSGIPFTVGVDGEWNFEYAPTSNQTSSRYVIQVDGTVGTTGIATFTIIEGAPVLTNAVDNNTGETTGTGSIDTDVADGTLYYLASMNPSESESVLLASDSQAVTASGTQNVAYTGLDSGVIYYGHFFHVAAVGAKSVILSGNGFVTDAGPIEVAPVLTNPTGSKVGSDGTTGNVTTDKGDGVLYYLVSTNATESVGNVKAGSSQAVAAVGVQSVSVSGLQPATTYYLHYVHTDAGSRDSNVASSSSYVTDADPIEVAPVLTNPTASKEGSSGTTGDVTTDKGDGVLYYLVSTNASESVGSIKAGSSQAVSAAGVQSVSVSGLQPATTYYLHYVHTDAGSRDSNVASSSSYVTDAGITPLVITAVSPVRLASTFTITTDGSYDLTDATSLHCTVAGIVVTNPLSITATQVSFVCPSVGLSLEDLSDVILLLEP